MWNSILRLITRLEKYSWGSILKLMITAFVAVMLLMVYEGKIDLRSNKIQDVKIKDIEEVNKIVFNIHKEMGTRITVRMFQPDQLNKEYLTFVAGIEIDGSRSIQKIKIRIAEMGEVYLQVVHGITYKSPPDISYDYLLTKFKQLKVTQFVAVPIYNPNNSREVIGFISSMAYGMASDLTDEQIEKLEEVYAAEISEALIE
jgi:hypothetical protein